MRRLVAIAGCGLMLAAAAATARADGGTVQAVQGGLGVHAPGGKLSYVAVPAPRGTLVELIDRRAGGVFGWRFIRGNLGLAGVGYDGSTTGLSADGRRLVLAEIPRTYPPRRTRLVVLDARRLRVLEHLSLPGFFTVDAISPDGRWLYFIHYESRRKLLRYEVRAYDLPARRLLRRPVVDPREPDEAMRGIAITRATSADGRWVYTFYSRPRGRPFVHALDTERRTAACIDVPGLGQDVSRVRLAIDGGVLRVLDGRRPRALIDTRTFALTRAASRVAVRHPRAKSGDPAGGPPVWLTVAIALGLLAALAATARARRRRTVSA